MFNLTYAGPCDDRVMASREKPRDRDESGLFCFVLTMVTKRSSSKEQEKWTQSRLLGRPVPLGSRFW